MTARQFKLWINQLDNHRIIASSQNNGDNYSQFFQISGASTFDDPKFDHEANPELDSIQPIIIFNNPNWNNNIKLWINQQNDDVLDSNLIISSGPDYTGHLTYYNLDSLQTVGLSDLDQSASKNEIKIGTHLIVIHDFYEN